MTRKTASFAKRVEGAAKYSAKILAELIRDRAARDEDSSKVQIAETDYALLIGTHLTAR